MIVAVLGCAEPATEPSGCTVTFRATPQNPPNEMWVRRPQLARLKESRGTFKAQRGGQIGDSGTYIYSVNLQMHAGYEYTAVLSECPENGDPWNSIRSVSTEAFVFDGRTEDTFGEIEFGP